LTVYPQKNWKGPIDTCKAFKAFQKKNLENKLNKAKLSHFSNKVLLTKYTLFSPKTSRMVSRHLRTSKKPSKTKIRESTLFQNDKISTFVISQTKCFYKFSFLKVLMLLKDFRGNSRCLLGITKLIKVYFVKSTLFDR
jgi:hypothetical protein